MKINRTKNAKRNISWGVIERIFSLLFQFISRTVIIKILGEDFLGLSSLFTSLLQVLNMAELGFSSAIIFNLYKPIAENDEKTICALMNAYKKIYRIIGIVVLIIGVLLLPALRHLINGDIPENTNIYILYFIYLSNTVVSYFLFAYKNCLLEAHQRNDIISKTKLILSFFQYLYQIVILIILKNYYLYIMILPIITILNNIVNSVMISKLYPKYICKGNISEELKEKIKINVTGLAIGKICLVSRNSLDNIFLSAFINLSTVAIYNNYYYIFTAINTFLAVITSAISSGIGNSVAIENEEKNYNDFKMFNFLYLWISGWCTICLAILYQPFMKIWMGEELLFNYSTVICLCVYFYALKLGDIRSIYSNVTGLFWESRFYVISEAVLNAILNYILGKKFGVNGIIIATNLTIIFINFIFGSRVLFKNYFKNQSLNKFFGENLFYACVTVLNCSVMIAICQYINTEIYFEFLIKSILCVIIPNIIYVIIYNKTKVFKNSKEFIKTRILKLN